MRRFGFMGIKVILPALVAALLLLAISWRARSVTATALVPAYFYPTGSGLDAWNRLAHDSGSINLEAILNPASGPGASRDPRYVAVVNKLRAAGGRIFGYVSTQYGKRDMSSVTADINNYVSFYNINGIFLDEMANTREQLPYFEQLYEYIKRLDSGFKVIGNPGMPYTLEGYLGAADTLVIFEGSSAGYADFKPMAAAPWVANYPRARFANIVYAAAAETDLFRALDLASQNRAGSIFITDKRLPNPYQGLPTYWPQEVAAVQARGPTLAPRKKLVRLNEPGTRPDRESTASAPRRPSPRPARRGVNSTEPTRSAMRRSQ